MNEAGEKWASAWASRGVEAAVSLGEATWARRSRRAWTWSTQVGG
jgi:hypothetical protein